MIRPLRTIRRLLVATSLLVTMTAPLPVLADTHLVTTTAVGLRTASVADLTLTAVAYSHSAQTQTGTMTLTAADETTEGLGWNVTILSSDFVYTGTNGGIAIPAANFAITAANAPVFVSGQAIDPVGGPKVPATSPVGALNSARKVIQAEATFGKGTYTQELNVSLSIPAMSRAGTYTGTLTTTIAAAP
ncbi:MAG: hypothetical protein QOF33_1357 [Thermomicrobiales bacterium]|jgi:hypothetical protein|nr:hypothetical protein [Thermomicrobiales bacterium]